MNVFTSFDLRLMRNVAPFVTMLMWRVKLMQEVKSTSILVKATQSMEVISKVRISNGLKFFMKMT